MLRPICWTEKMSDGVKREVRVTFLRDRIRWQFKLATDEHWDYTTAPSAEDWNVLVKRTENRYQRRNVSYEDLELARRCRQDAIKDGARLPR